MGTSACRTVCTFLVACGDKYLRLFRDIWHIGEVSYNGNSTDTQLLRNEQDACITIFLESNSTNSNITPNAKVMNLYHQVNSINCRYFFRIRIEFLKQQYGFMRARCVLASYAIETGTRQVQRNSGWPNDCLFVRLWVFYVHKNSTFWHQLC